MSTAVAERSAAPIVVFNEQLDARMEQFRAALPDLTGLLDRAD